MMLIVKHIFPVLTTYFLQLLCVLSIFLFMTKCFVNVLMFLLMMLLLILLISDSSFFLIPPPWHTTWSQEMTGGSAWHNCGSCCKEKLEKLFLKKHVFNTDSSSFSATFQFIVYLLFVLSRWLGSHYIYH